MLTIDQDSIKAGELRWCCDNMKFMIDNEVAEPNIMSVMGRVPSQLDDSTVDVCVGYLSGVKVTRAFFLFSRDQMFYRCPFCHAELIKILDVFNSAPIGGTVLVTDLIEPGPYASDKQLKIPMSTLKEALNVTRERSERNRVIRR